MLLYGACTSMMYLCKEPQIFNDVIWLEILLYRYKRVLTQERCQMRAEKRCRISTFNTIVGAMDDNGLLPGWIKLAGAGGGILPFRGMEKSSISLLRSIPVLGETIWAPKYEFTVRVIETAFLSPSTMDAWLVPWSCIWFHLNLRISKTRKNQNRTLKIRMKRKGNHHLWLN